MKNVITMCSVFALTAGAALAEGQLNIYNWSDYIAEDTIKKFEEATGIRR